MAYLIIWKSFFFMCWMIKFVGLGYTFLQRGADGGSEK